MNSKAYFLKRYFLDKSNGCKWNDRQGKRKEKGKVCMINFLYSKKLLMALPLCEKWIYWMRRFWPAEEGQPK